MCSYFCDLDLDLDLQYEDLDLDLDFDSGGKDLDLDLNFEDLTTSLPSCGSNVSAQRMTSILNEQQALEII